MPRKAQPAPLDVDETQQAFLHALDGMFQHMLRAGNSRELARVNTTPIESRAMMWLRQSGPVLMSELASNMAIPLSTATHLVNRLVEKGWVSRERSENDRRIVRVDLSTNGHKLSKRLYAMRIEASRSILAKLQPDEQQALIALLKKTV